jgi:hypothetical protein
MREGGAGADRSRPHFMRRWLPNLWRPEKGMIDKAAPLA